VYYTFITVFFISKSLIFIYFIDQARLSLDYMVDRALMAAGWDIGDQEQGAFIMDLIVTLVVCIYLYPLCIIKEFHRIKVRRDVTTMLYSTWAT